MNLERERGEGGGGGTADAPQGRRYAGGEIVMALRRGGGRFAG